MHAHVCATYLQMHDSYACIHTAFYSWDPDIEHAFPLSLILQVVYETVRFLDKNNDTIHDELIAMLSDSTVPFVRTLRLCARSVDSSA